MNAALSSAMLVLVWWVGRAALALLAPLDSTNLHDATASVLSYLYAFLGVAGIVAVF